jgi:ABC-type bacteriocin/lantibiotic exporter with double-glycine peptidase domain
VLSDVDFEVAPKARIGVNGVNGSGKSTLLDLILGLRQPTRGAVEIEGIDLREMRIEEIRTQISLVRRVELFDGTLLENIRVGRAEISIEDVRLTLSQVGLLDEIAQLPDGLLTNLTGSLNPLSAGQAQRLMLARAIVGKPKLLLLDEALENIDAETKGKILGVLTDPAAPWTLILASHDSFELSHCGEVLRLHAGRLHGPNEGRTS